jgi:hypothetical protein
MKSKKGLLTGLALALVISVPYIYAAAAGGTDYVFNGFLLSLGDSNSYLAKMYEGWQGSWRFVLPYTADPGQGAYIYLPYLFFGHLARWLGIPLIIMFHVIRVAGSECLLAALLYFYRVQFEDEQQAWQAAVWAMFGSGLGWLFLFGGKVTADQWVVDAYPFLMAYSIPHFTFATALILWLVAYLSKNRQDRTLTGRILCVLGAAGAALFSAFGVVLLMGVKITADVLDEHRLDLEGILLLAIGGLPIAAYQAVVMVTDPILAGWNRQNWMPSPNVLDLLISFSPALPLALVGIYVMLRQKQKGGRRMAAWMLFSVTLILIPVSLQRRFILGLYIPVVGLAVLGISHLAQAWKRSTKRLGAVMLALSLPTNLLILVMGVYGGIVHAPVLYLSSAEAHALEWISAHAAQQALVLASPDTALFIPSRIGRRVIYGHLYETVPAEAELLAVTRFFQGSQSPQEANAFLDRRQVDFIFWGAREKAIGSPDILTEMPVVFQEGEVTLYAVPHPEPAAGTPEQSP